MVDAIKAQVIVVVLKTIFHFRSKVWLYPGMAGWHFTSVPKAMSEKIKKLIKVKRGWGSIPVTVTVEKVSWKTSIFPDKKSGTYLLPLKSAIRKKVEIAEGDTVRFSIELG